MLSLQAKFLDKRELPEQPPYPASYLVSVLEGTDTLHLIASGEVFAQLDGVEPFADVAFELRWRRIDLAGLGGTGKGKAYRLSITGLADA